MTLAADSFWQRLWHTRLRDVVRGRIDGQLDWQSVIAEANLPKNITDAISTVLCKARLWRIERVDVSHELIAHFQDGLETGRSAEELVASFGDVKQAARLIRHAKKRGRPLVWHAWRWAFWSLGIFLAVYLGAALYLLSGKPSVTTDYLAIINQRAAAVPTEKRAWPLYREALLELGFRNGELPESIRKEPLYPFDERNSLVLKSFLVEHPQQLAKLRQAAAVPSLGYEVAFTTRPEDQELLGDFDCAPAPGEVHPNLLSLPFSHLERLRVSAFLLAADCNLAATEKDAHRAQQDVIALTGITRQLNESPWLISGFIACSVQRLACDAMGDSLARQPELWSNEDLAELAHCIAAVKFDLRWWLESERISSLDTIQRIYSDDGHGSGNVTYQGLEYLRSNASELELYLPASSNHPLHNNVIEAGLPIAVALMASRRDFTDVLNKVWDETIAIADQPLWQGHGIRDPFDKIAKSKRLRIKYAPLMILFPAIQAARTAVERTEGQQDGTLIGIALELYRRQHGDWPKSLDELAPTFLPTVPIDRINGGPLVYQIVDHQVIVYSLGVDGDDDNARVPIVNGQEEPNNAAPNNVLSINRHLRSNPHYDGDWVIWSTVRENGDRESAEGAVAGDGSAR